MHTASFARPGPRRILAVFVAALLALFGVSGQQPAAHAQSNGAAVTPLMGWSS
jgi:hypothetical protein